MTPLILALAVVTSAPPATPPPRDQLRFGLNYRWWGRNLQVQGSSSISGASVGPLPTGASLDIQWFPMAYFQSDWRADVGLTVRADIAPEFTLRSGENTFKASTARLRTGVMFRVPFDHVEPSVNLGLHAFEASTRPRTGTPRPPLPNSSLTGPRLGLDLRLLEFWRMTFDLGVGGTLLVTTGELGSAAYFPGAKGNAFDGTIGLALRTWPFLDVRLGVDLTVHSLTLGNGVTAIDTYYGFSLGLIFKGVSLPGNRALAR